MTSLPPSLTVARWTSRSSTSTSASVSIWAERTSPGCSTTRRTVFTPSPVILKGICLRFRMISVASSTTPGIGLNSCSTPSMRTAVMAAPSMELRSTRRKLLPIVVPKPRWNGCAVNMPYRSVRDSVFATRRLGFWKPLNINFEWILLLRIQFHDELFVQLDLHQLAALGQSGDFAGETFAVHVDPVRGGGVGGGIAGGE